MTATGIHEEEILGKAYDSRLMKRLLKYLKPYMWYVVLGIIMSISVAALEGVRPYFTKLAVDTNIAQHDSSGLLTTIMLFLGVLLIRGVIQYFNAYLTQWIGQRTIFDIRMQVFRHLQGLALKFFDRNPIGRLVTRLTNDVEVLNEMFSSGIVMVFSDVFTIFWILYFMFSMSWQLALVTLCVLPLLFWATALFRRKVREVYRLQRILVARLNTFLQEHISGIMVVQIFNRERQAYAKFDSINADHRDANIKSVLYYAVFYPGIDLIQAIAFGLIIWYAGGHVFQGTISLGIVMAFFQYTEMFFRPIRDLSEKYNILQNAMASSERLFKLLDDTTRIPDSPSPTPMLDVRGKVEFRNVWFAYNDEEWVLKNISFTIEPGQTVAIVGHTGAGKTSIINLLGRSYDILRGEILIDGVDIRMMAIGDLRRRISVVLQDVFLFSGDIRTNITLGNPDITEEKMHEAATLVGADRFIDRLPGRYQAEVKERGATLSVGQKQLLSFARALAFDPAILVLDEATSSVDTDTEILIQSATQKLLQGRTSIVIAHRLSTIQNADNIIVLHKGEIRETGTHQQLLAHGGIYYKLYQLQYKDQEVRQKKYDKSKKI
jgi:ATP-binding cassette, subfamily B, multidrug efflux pump